MRHAMHLGLAFAAVVGCSSGGSDGGGTLDVSADCAAVCAAAAQQCGWADADRQECSAGCSQEYKGLSSACASQADAAFSCANQGSTWDCSTGNPTGCSSQVDALEECQQQHSAGVPGGLGPYCDKCAACAADASFGEGFCDPFRSGASFDTAACVQNGDPSDIDDKNLSAAELAQMSCAEFDGAI